MRAGFGLRQRHRAVPLQGRVVVDLRRLVEHAAVPVVGELVQAQVGHQHGVVAELVVQPAQRHVQHAVRVVGARAARVLVLGTPKIIRPPTPAAVASTAAFTRLS